MVKLVPTTVSGTELTPGPLYQTQGRKGPAFSPQPPRTLSALPPLPGRTSLVPGDLPALPELLLITLAALQGGNGGAAGQSSQI